MACRSPTLWYGRRRLTDWTRRRVITARGDASGCPAEQGEDIDDSVGLAERREDVVDAVAVSRLLAAVTRDGPYQVRLRPVSGPPGGGEHLGAVGRAERVGLARQDDDV
jgi:hypothetical protein